MRWMLRLVLVLVVCDASNAEMRVWNFPEGQSIEAEFVAYVGGEVSLRGVDGAVKKVPAKLFSPEDLSYIDLQLPPRLELDLSRTTEQRVFPESLTELPRSIYNSFTVSIKQTSTRPYGHELVAELFVYADEIDGDKHILLNHETVTFTLTEGSRSVFEFSTDKSELLDYVVAGQRRGEKYGGYILIVTDKRGEVIAYSASSESLYGYVDNLREVPVKKHFDDEGNRCFPTSPKRMY